MKALLFPEATGQSWYSDFFPGKSLLSLPITGKSYAEHLMDIMSLTKISSVALLDYDYDPIFAEVLSNGERWSRELIYEGCSRPKNLQSLLARYKKFLGEEDFLIIYGPVLPITDSFEKLSTSFKSVEFDQLPAMGIFRCRDGKWEINTLPEYKIDSLKSYYDLNFKLLNDPGVYVLPGYSGKLGQYLGMNTSISPAAILKSPVLAGDYTCIEQNCHLSEGVILGKNVTVGQGTILRHSLIMNHVMIGGHMEIVSKIIRGNHVIDPETGASIEVEEDLALNLKQPVSCAQHKFEDWLISLVLVFLFLPGYLLIPVRKWRKKLALEYYWRYWQVLRGRISLFYTGESMKSGVFPAYEGLSGKSVGFQAQLDGIYYYYYHSLLMSLKMFINVLRRKIRK